MTATRQEVYAAIDSEYAYQRKWDTEASKGLHTVPEWLVYFQDYLTEAMHQVSRGADPAASQHALNTIRKIVTMGVSCMEQHGAPLR